MLGYAELVCALPVFLGEYAAIWLCLRVVLSAQQHVRHDDVMARWHTPLLQVRLRWCLAYGIPDPPFIILVHISVGCYLLVRSCRRYALPSRLTCPAPISQSRDSTLHQYCPQVALAVYPVQALIHFQLALRNSGGVSSDRVTRAKSY